MKYRNIVCILLCVCLATAFAGCSDKDTADSKVQGGSSSVGDVINERISEEDSSGTNEGSGEGGDTAAPDDEAAGASNPLKRVDYTGDIDVDLTVLSANMVYAEVYNMMWKPNDYVGKIVKMSGLYTMYHDEYTENDYFACIIEDATACCAQGVEFRLTDDYTYPADYPEMGDRITVVGEFTTYMEGEIEYFTLKDAVFAA